MPSMTECENNMEQSIIISLIEGLGAKVICKESLTYAVHNGIIFRIIATSTGVEMTMLTNRTSFGQEMFSQKIDISQPMLKETLAEILEGERCQKKSTECHAARSYLY